MNATILGNFILLVSLIAFKVKLALMALLLRASRVMLQKKEKTAWVVLAFAKLDLLTMATTMNCAAITHGFI